MANQRQRRRGPWGRAGVIALWLMVATSCGPEGLLPRNRETIVGHALNGVHVAPPRAVALLAPDATPDPADDAAANWLAQVVDAFNRAAPAAVPRDQRVLRDAARITDALSNARLAYIEQFTEVFPSHDIDLESFEKPEEIRALIERFHPVRMSLHEVQVQLSECETRLANGLIDDGVDATLARAEGHAFASGARFDVLQELFTLERQMHEALLDQLQFLLEQWGAWEVSTADPDLIYGEEHVFAEFDRHDRRLGMLWGQLHACVSRLAHGPGQGS